MNIVDPLKTCEINCNECTMKDEVESYIEDIVVEKEEQFFKKEYGKQGTYDRKKT